MNPTTNQPDHNPTNSRRAVKQRIAAVMKWCIAQGFRQDMRV